MKLENIYLVIMFRYVFVSFKWRFFKLLLVWVIEFLFVDFKLVFVRDVWILLEEGNMARLGYRVGLSYLLSRVKVRGMYVLRGLFLERSR